jgi:hypothetical protein
MAVCIAKSRVLQGLAAEPQEGIDVPDGDTIIVDFQELAESTLI